MPMPRVITTPTDLVKYLANILGNEWTIRVDESEGVDKAPGCQPRKFHHWYLSVTCSEPVRINVYLFEKTFASLVKAVDEKLWEKIRDAFEKASVQWQKPGQPDAIENRKRGIGVKPKGIEHKQAALPHKPQGQQLLLLPAPAAESVDVNHCRCHWPDCTEVVGNQWACRRHWQLLTPQIQDFISQKYRPQAMRQSDEYFQVEKYVFKWIKARHPEEIHGPK